jgi:hypothetical protein
MRGPDSATSDETGCCEPDQPSTTLSDTRAREHARSRRARKEAENARENNKSQIVLLGNAAKNAQHNS